MAMSPTARSLKLLRTEGYSAAVAETWIPNPGIKRDLFGMFDVVAVHPAIQGVLGVQTTSGAHHANRRAKLLGNPTLAIWLKAGNPAQVWSWAQFRGRWECRKEALTLETEGLAAMPLTLKRQPKRQRRGERQGELFYETEKP